MMEQGGTWNIDLSYTVGKNEFRDFSWGNP